MAAAVACAAAGLPALGCIIAQPWWSGFPTPLVPVLAVLQAVALLAAPLLFVIGMAGYGPVGHALGQAAAELQVLI